MLRRYDVFFLVSMSAGCGGTVASVGPDDDAGLRAGDDGGSSPDAGAFDATVDGGRPATDAGASDAVTARDAGPDVSTVGCEGRPPLPPDVPQPPSGMACGFPDAGATFPLFDKCCTKLSDCLMGTFQYRCCGDTYTFGMNKAEFLAFDALRAQWQCAECGCASGGDHTEDGLTAVFPTVSCDNGYCMSHGQK
jgi:hypothetical protein